MLILIKSLEKVRDCQVKYSITQNTVIGLWKTDPSSSQIRYAPFLLQKITIWDLKYFDHIFLFRDFSNCVFQIKTKFPFLKSKFLIVWICFFSKQMAVFFWASNTIE